MGRPLEDLPGTCTLNDVNMCRHEHHHPYATPRPDPAMCAIPRFGVSHSAQLHLPSTCRGAASTVPRSHPLGRRRGPCRLGEQPRKGLALRCSLRGRIATKRRCCRLVLSAGTTPVGLVPICCCCCRRGPGHRRGCGEASAPIACGGQATRGRLHRVEPRLLLCAWSRNRCGGAIVRERRRRRRWWRRWR